MSHADFRNYSKRWNRQKDNIYLVEVTAFRQMIQIASAEGEYEKLISSYQRPLLSAATCC